MKLYVSFTIDGIEEIGKTAWVRTTFKGNAHVLGSDSSFKESCNGLILKK